MNVILLTFLLSSSCPKTIVINKSNESWNKTDEFSLKFNQKRCGQIYKYSPCLKRFIKLKHNSYFALCGRSK